MQRWRIGSVTVTRVIELEGPVPGPFLLADATPERLERHAAWLRPRFLDDKGRIIATTQAFLVESGGRRIIVDTCVGNDKPRPNPFWNQLHLPFLEELVKVGFARERVDTVLCTHLHVDHVGWNTTLVAGRWMPTFPNARYLFARAEWEYWRTTDYARDGEVHGDSVRPILDAGLADLVPPDHRLTDEVGLEPTPGHTPGHTSVRISSQGEDAVITGDVMHHPVQCAEPEWASNFDVDPEAARRTRKAFLARYADRAVLVFGTHFATPAAGRIVRDGTVWRFVPEESRTC
jgi:glyoxylase-like metal-dependent hydrolase (beta-lactamase superfamily II)